MAERKQADEAKNPVTRMWRAIARPSPSVSVGVLLVVGFAAGIVFWGGYNWAMELSNSEGFCVSCHEMRDNPFKELKETAHYANPSGVRATCADCHVPKEWHHKVVRKMQATFNELPRHLLGTIDTSEKFEARRLELARNVWAAMKANDSRECRNCHGLASMKIEEQVRPARRRHAEAKETGATCIDCHKGIAHRLPKGWDQPG
jgi:cytochrome c-type protein NapC